MAFNLNGLKPVKKLSESHAGRKITNFSKVHGIRILIDDIAVFRVYHSFLFLCSKDFHWNQGQLVWRSPFC